VDDGSGTMDIYRIEDFKMESVREETRLSKGDGFVFVSSPDLATVFAVGAEVTTPSKIVLVSFEANSLTVCGPSDFVSVPVEAFGAVRLPNSESVILETN